MDDQLLLKIHNGTRSDAIHLCRTCRQATFAKGAGESQEIIKCAAFNAFVRLRIFECSSYLDRTKPTFYEMEQIAWMIVTKSGGRQIGFLSPQERGVANLPPSHPPALP
jgi:hypothetical protein